MQLKKLPIGIQTFSTIRNENYIYIDKTQDAFELIDKYKFVFLSRPRRFGKSLFLDTLQCIFEGRKELFEGLYIYDKYDWNDKYPVIKISFIGKFSSEDGISNTFNKILKNICADLGVNHDEKIDVQSNFDSIIKQTYAKYGKQVVILIDEYDKMMLDNITDPVMMKYARNELKSFYEIIKDNSNLVKFAFITGITKFSKVSIFSGLNNLVDITLMEQFGNICGYTHNDIETVLNPYLQNVDLNDLKKWYNGYYFLKDKVYNPYDILLFIDNKFSYKNYWFETGTPTFLIELIKKQNYYLPNLENITLSESDLSSFDIENINIEVFLFQAGYLTIKEQNISFDGTLEYDLIMPNREVSLSLYNYILQYLYRDRSKQRKNSFNSLIKGDLNGFKNSLNILFESIPYENYVNNNIQIYEGFYAAMVYVYLRSLGIGLELNSEMSTNRGRIDLVVEVQNKVYIIEFKTNQENALQQIKDKNYAAKFLNQNKEIYLVGINFDTKVRNVAKFEYEKL